MNKIIILIKCLFGYFLTYILINTIFGGVQWNFMSNINLIFHEAGHTLLFWAPNLLVALGGTIFQIIIPVILIIYFFHNQKIYGVAFSTFWLSTSLYNIGVYASDARAQELPLIGGMHDWTYILSRLNILQYDLFVGRIFTFLALLAAIITVYLLVISIKSDIQKGSRK